MGCAGIFFLSTWEESDTEVIGVVKVKPVAGTCESQPRITARYRCDEERMPLACALFHSERQHADGVRKP